MGARRALLYVPGDDLHKIKKAATLNADCICLDLEDGVATNRKEDARQTITHALATQDFNRSECLVRINPVHSHYAAQDLEAVLPARPGGIVIPKVADSQQVISISSRIGTYESGNNIPPGSIRLLAIIESSWAIVNLAAIASADPRLDALIFGAEDYAADIGAQRTDDGWEVFYARSAVITYSAANNLQAIDMVNANFKDLKALRRQSIQGAKMGFTGKQVIHPDQVPVVQTAFTPSDQEIQEAEELISQFARQQLEGRGAFAVNRTMVDAPNIRSAQSILERARAAGKLS